MAWRDVAFDADLVAGVLGQRAAHQRWIRATSGFGSGMGAWTHVDIDERIPEIPTPVSPGVIVVVLAVVAVAKPGQDAEGPLLRVYVRSLRATASRQEQARRG